MSPQRQRVAITGIGLVTPLGNDAPTSWWALLEGQSRIGPIESFAARSFPTRIAAEVKGFDPLACMERKEAKNTDRFVQFATAAALEALAHAGLDVDGERQHRKDEQRDAARLRSQHAEAVGR